jgi:hypothetical protein
MQEKRFYVSITGLELSSFIHLPRFWWLTIAAFRLARQSDGNLCVQAKRVDGVHHTLTVWTDEAAMRRFLVSGPHLQAMKAFRGIGSGKTLGFYASSIPDWQKALACWRAESKTV